MKLQEFAVDEKDTRKVRCRTCMLDADLLAQVEKARLADDPIAFRTISAWLKEDQNVDILPATLRNHFTAGHHNA